MKLPSLFSLAIQYLNQLLVSSHKYLLLYRAHSNVFAKTALQYLVQS